MQSMSIYYILGVYCVFGIYYVLGADLITLGLLVRGHVCREALGFFFRAVNV